MTIENKLKNYILSKYPTVKDFCDASKLSSSTIFTVFSRGVNNTSTKTIIKICKSLNIDSTALHEGVIKPIVTADSDSSVDVVDFIESIGSMDLTYKGRDLTAHEKKNLMYALRFALSYNDENK